MNYRNNDAIGVDMAPAVSMFDAHLHIIDPRFPLLANRGYVPDTFTCSDYRAQVADSGLDITGGAVVAGSFHPLDPACLIDALDQFGAGFVGVAQLPETTSDAEIQRLHEAGIRAVRFNLYRGGTGQLEYLDRLAHRINALVGWSVELYVDSGDLPALEPRLAALPRVAIDHLGMTRAGYPALLRLVENGMRVKATGFGRVRMNIANALREIAAANPAALMFGTDLPGTRAPRPFEPADLALLWDTLGDALARQAVRDNAEAWYGLRA